MKKISESAVSDNILAEARKYNTILFRNNVGLCTTRDGSVIRYGLHKGSADFIGLKSVLITPEMVGTTLAVFVSVEVKHSNWKPAKTPSQHEIEQNNWRDQMLKRGAIAGYVTSEEDLAKLLA